MKRKLIVALGIVAVGAAAFLLLFQRPLAVEVVRSERDVAVQVFGLGTIEARILSHVGFQRPGSIVALAADARDTVKRGDVLARIEDSEQKARLAKAAANLDRARAEVGRAEAKVTRARAVLTQRRQINERRQELVRKATVSVEAAEDARTEVDLAMADVAVAMSETEVAAAAQRDAEAQRALEAALLDQHTLTAPYDAVIVSRHRELGAVVAPGERVFTLIDPNTLWALVYVDEAAAGALAIGQPAEVVLRSLPGRVFHAQVVRIDVESDRVTEERRVYLKCTGGCPDDYHLGEQIEATVTVANLDEALLVPETAVERLTATGGLVWTLEDGALARREVRFGHKTLDGRLQITGGLPEGAQVLARLPDGPRIGRAARAKEDAR